MMADTSNGPSQV